MSEPEVGASLGRIEGVASNLALPLRGEDRIEARASRHVQLPADVLKPLNELQHRRPHPPAHVVGAVRVALGSNERRLRHVADVDVITGLTAVAVHNRPLAAEKPSAEDRDHPPCPARILPRSVDVREAQIDRREAMHAPIQVAVALRRKLRLRIWRDWSDGCLLAERRRAFAVDGAPGRRIDEPPYP